MQFNDLPIEVFERIMRYLDFQSLSTMFRVSSRYRDIIAKNSINILDFINPTYDIEGYSEKKLSLGMLKLLRYILPIPIMKGLLNDAWNITQGKIGRLSIHDCSCKGVGEVSFSNAFVKFRSPLLTHCFANSESTP